MLPEYFEKLYDCKKKLLNELLVIQKIGYALSYSGLGYETEYYANKIQSLKQEIKDMEVDLEQEKEAKLRASPQQ